MCWLSFSQFKKLHTNLNVHLDNASTSLFLYFVIAFSIGIGVYFNLSFEPSIYFFSVTLAFCIILGITSIFVRTKLSILNLWLCLICFAFTFGFCRSWIETRLTNTYFISQTYKDVTFEGILENIEEQTSKKNRYEISAITFDSTDSNLKKIERIRLRGPHLEKLSPTQKIKCTATLLPFSDPVSPFGYNFKRDYFFKGISATGTIKSCSFEENTSFKISSIRYAITKKLRQQLKKPYGDIAAALITGDRSGIDDHFRQSFTDSGLAHLLAISGLHMGLLAGIIFFFTRRLISLFYLRHLIPDFIPIKEISACITITMMLLYLGISGYGYPAIRSFLMTTLLMIGILCARNPISMRSLALAGFSILFIFPHSLLSPSFQLSFSAVISLIATYDFLNTKIVKIKIRFEHIPKIILNLLIYFLGILITTLIVTIAITPLSMAIFNRLTIQAILGNILAIPLTAFWLMPCALLSTLSLLLGGSEYIFCLFGNGLKILCSISEFVSKLPGAGIRIQSPSPWFYWIFSLAGLLMCIGPFVKIRMFGLCGFLISILSFKNSDIPIGYITKDRSVMAFYQKPYLWVSHKKQGSFYTKQWSQHLGLTENMIQQIPTQIWQWNDFTIIVDPYKAIIDSTIKTYNDKRKFISSILGKSPSYSNSKIISNIKTFTPMQENWTVNGEKLYKNGSAFIYSNGTIKYQNELNHNRPWSK